MLQRPLCSVPTASAPGIQFSRFTLWEGLWLGDAWQIYKSEPPVSILHSGL